MKLCVLFALVLHWSCVVEVYTRFYLETADGKDEQLTVILHECVRTRHKSTVALRVKCIKIEEEARKQEIYAVANFNSVLGLKLLIGSTIRIDGRIRTGKLSHVLTVGVEPRAFDKPGFKSTCTHIPSVRSHLDRISSCFIDFDDSNATLELLEYFSINNPGFFFHWNTHPAWLFHHYANVLQRVMRASKKLRGNFWRRVLSKGLSIIEALKSLFKFVWSPSPTPAQCDEKCLTYSASNHESESGTASSSSSLSPSPLKKDVLRAIGLLAFKMFDPCFILNVGPKERAQAAAICTTYCQFLGLKIHNYEKPVSKSCKNLNTGQCEDKVCTCSKLRLDLNTVEDNTKSVNMLFCNNALRLIIYRHRAKYSFSF